MHKYAAPDNNIALSRISRVSDPAITSPAQRSSAYRESLSPGSRSPSQSRSRAPSPLRLFHQWSAGRHRHRHHSDDPFVPIDPYKFKIHFHLPCFHSDSETQTPRIPTHTRSPESTDTTRSGACACVPMSSTKVLWNNARIFLGDTLPREVYLNILLRLPAMYFSRVARIFQDAEVSRPDIHRMIDSGGGLNISPLFGPSASEQVTVDSGIPNAVRAMEYPPTPASAPAALSPTMAAGIGLAAQVGTAAAGPHLPLPLPEEWTTPHVSPALIRFKNSWEVFVDSLIREWKTLNVVSALLLSYVFFSVQAIIDSEL
ncbi:hypothetical protein C0992_008942 [Termitomyces sp. T32_za158]|nr:hypothetical protein C0992_008942 [Termitomyces sp. T32_za158]